MKPKLMQASAGDPGERGRVVASFGRSFTVDDSEGVSLHCVVAGKKTGVAVGDWVIFRRTSPDQGVIDRIEERQSLLYRSDEFRQKILAANVTQICIVVAPRPSFYEALIDKCLVAAEAAGIRACVVLNKIDLPEVTEARTRLERFQAIGYPLVELSAKADVGPLKSFLHGQVSVLVGQSGMGKSSIINALIPEAGVRTGDISEALDSGRHTTTHAKLYHLDAESILIDSPGLQEFGLNHLNAAGLPSLFPDFRTYLSGCRFANCTHRHEPGCRLREALAAGRVHPARYAVYAELLEILLRPARY